jgi:hypothetical protein
MSEKKIALALEIAKRARSKKSFGPDETRKARLHNILFDTGDLDLGADDLSLDLSEGGEEKPPSKPDRKARLASLLDSFPLKTKE